MKGRPEFIMNKFRPQYVFWVILTCTLFYTTLADARAFSEKGADTCLKCHDEDNEYPVFPFFETKHATIKDPRSPMADMQCETCHGPVGGHKDKRKKGQKRIKMIAFGAKSTEPVSKQNKICLQCHEDRRRSNWHGSAHEMNKLSCASCHRIHVKRDPVLVKTQQPHVCQGCHKTQRAQFQMASSHPVRYGKMYCSQCHNPHGSNGEKLVNANTTNQLCYQCHAEKRGPFLWSHAPVDEDCTQCHKPHGSPHRTLLSKRPPLLCQQCHSMAGHPSLNLDPGSLAGNSGFLVSKSCLNCHAMVHGSNHPSGVRLMR